MSRTRPLAGPTISLFPFLAVLLCMMGALLVLLVLFSRSVKIGGQQEAAADTAELELAKESLAWRLTQLQGVRDRTAEDLAKARMQLAGTEEHARELTDELERLERMHADLAGNAGSNSTAAAEVAALEAKLKNARELLDKSRAELATKPPAYAVVPYVGVNGTHRRPLYIECCIDGVFLQPEGIRLNPSDFEGPAGPGNPLASALRAAREHIAKSPRASGDPAVQPYPLLLVRPSGVMAYYVAREAIQSWGSEFGYQLVDEDWTLEFPPRDPTLAEVEKRAIDESRRRLEWLAQVRPARPAKPSQQYRAATTRGGVVAEGGPSVLGDQSRWNWTSQQAEQGGAGGGPGGSAPNGNAAQDSGMAGGNAAGRVGPGRPLAAGGSADGSFDAEGTGTGDAILGGAGGGPGSRQDAGGRPSGLAGAQGGTVGGAAGSGAGGDAAGSGGDPATAGGAAADRYQAVSRFASTRGSATGNGSAAPGGQAGGSEAGSATSAANGSAAGSAAGSSAGASAGASDSSASGAGGGSSMGMAASGGPAMPGLKQGGSASGQDSASSASASASIAQARGKNWASLATQDRPIPLTRPIRVECTVDEFRILDDSGRRVQSRIHVDGDTAVAIDPLVKAIHSRVEGWGLAGERMYWKPQLVLSATADGQSRRDDLERLLADSGLDTRQKGREDEIRSLPPVRRTSYLTSEP